MTHKLAIAEIIRTKLLGVHPDDQDVQLEDSDWRVILAALATPDQAVMAERERCAQVLENLCFFTPVEELMGMTKQEMSVRTCIEGAAAIRAQGETK